MSKRGRVAGGRQAPQHNANDPTLWLQYVRDHDDYSDSFAWIDARPLGVTWYLDWGPLEQAGAAIKMGVFNMLMFMYGHNNGIRVWERTFSLHDEVYVELCKEFLSSLVFKNRHDSTKTDFLRFRLGGVDRSLSKVGLAQALGLYPELNNLNLQHYLTQTEYYGGEFFNDVSYWNDLSGQDFKSSRSKCVEIRDKNDRLLHRYVACTFNARINGNDKVTTKDLWIMDQIKRKRRTDIPGLIGSYLYDQALEKRSNKPLLGGHYITKIARAFDIDLSRLTPHHTPMPSLNAAFYVKAKFLAYDSCRNLIPFIEQPQAGGASGSGTGAGDDDENMGMPDAPSVENRWAPTQTAWDGLVSGFSEMHVGYQSQETQFGQFREEQRQHNQRMEEMARASRYDQAWNNYRGDWLRHNSQNFFQNPADYHGTSYQTPVYYDNPDHPPAAPVYDERAAMEDAQRRFQEEYPDGRPNRGGSGPSWWPFGDFLG